MNRAGSWRTCSRAAVGFKSVRIFLARATSEAFQCLLEFRKERSKSGSGFIGALAIRGRRGDFLYRVKVEQGGFIVQHLEGCSPVLGLEAAGKQAATLE
jgi:hypothetical protein